ncbi:Fic family protein [Fibrobacter intestinalis]|uniref:Fic family protein n=1 Tax=Fibrobacter intestinalis TaxID=28122 RepID=A0A1T4KHP7_9BACT|nr:MULTISPECIES: Fic family protein [Fibrobacter]PBC73789.1 Fic family protein [Fibrobacter sp. NR9]SJZ41962.1 Fic family protein [Fibrobacter intestinalis]
MLEFICGISPKYDVSSFLNELIDSSKFLGMLEAKISDYRFNGVLLPMLHTKEALASMEIEGTQTTVTNILEDQITSTPSDERIFIEYRNHIRTLSRSEDILRVDDFSNDFIQKIHLWMMEDVLDASKYVVGKYKIRNNYIVGWQKKIIYEPPEYTETKKYMDDLVGYMNNRHDNINPLIKAAIVHSQFESIHPFEDGNGRVGRTLTSLYMFKSKIITHPHFYLSEALNQDKLIYYSKLSSSRTGNQSEWISFFLKKIIVQAKKQIHYIESLNTLYEKTRQQVKTSISSPKFDGIMTILFEQPVMTAKVLENRLNISNLQANRYLDTLQRIGILYGNDRKRNRMYYFMELLDLMRR